MISVGYFVNCDSNKRHRDKQSAFLCEEKLRHAYCTHRNMETYFLRDFRVRMT